MSVARRLNVIELSGILLERQALRFTPAGLAVSEALLKHGSEQLEAGLPRRVDCEVQVIALGATAQWLNAVSPGTELLVRGFLAARSRNSKQLRVHITAIEFAEGKNHA